MLIIPEGFKSETIKMLILSISCPSYFKDKKFIFRFHPMIDQKLFFENLSTDKKNKFQKFNFCQIKHFKMTLIELNTLFIRRYYLFRF